MEQLPPEDQPDIIDIGPIDSIPVFDEDDPRLDHDRQLWAAARTKAQAMHTADELLRALQADPDWRVRHEVVDRLIARGRDDERALRALIRSVRADAAWQVRDAVAMRLHEFDPRRVVPALISATSDTHPEVRSSARYSLAQLGVAHPG